jgi:hypothetical protein
VNRAKNKGNGEMTMKTLKRLLWCLAVFVPPVVANADVVTEWNQRVAQITLAGRLGPPDSWNVIAASGVAVSDALAAISGQPPIIAKLDRVPDAAPEAAVAAASHAVLAAMVPGQKTAIDDAYTEAVAKLPEAGKEKGIKLGSAAAQAVITARKVDQEPVESYRPATTAGKYVPTLLPIALTTSLRKPWVLDSCEQFRPGPPPELTSAVWARDYNEIKALGAKSNSKRTPDQTEIAKFWEAVHPIIYLPVAYSVANRDMAVNARVLAIMAMAVDDALGAIFDAKYTYNFWRPVTAIRNGDIDGNDATERDVSWLPFIDTPMHPEYPCAHCVVSATIGTLVKAVLQGKQVELSTTSPTLPGKPHTWSNADDFMQEVALARILDGVHYRYSTEVGTDMGKKIGEFAAAKYLK